MLSKLPTEICIGKIFQCLFTGAFTDDKVIFAINPELRLNVVSKSVNNKDATNIKTFLVSDLPTESKIDSLVDLMKTDVMTSLRGDVFVAFLGQMVKHVSISVTQKSTAVKDAGKV